MKILFIAKHGQVNSNDDEGAVTFALEKLGHQVICIHEKDASAGQIGHDQDLVLFFKWHDLERLRRIEGPKAFWWFDLVDYPQDSSLAGRCAHRVKWMRDVLPLVDLGFCTDGDFAVNAKSCYRGITVADAAGKLAWLPQGADERVIGRGEPREPLNDVLFVGIRDGGRERRTFVQEMRDVYGPMFTHVERGVHGRALADLIASHKIVVAPDGPITDRYWSNRVYNMLGFGAFLLHPSCDRLREQYQQAGEVMYYHDRKDLHRLIAEFVNLPEARLRIAEAGLERTRREHLYRHRCEQLIRTVRERLGI